MLIDSHCHLALDAFDQDRPAVLARARQAGLTGLIDVGIDPASWQRSLALAAAHPRPTATAPAVVIGLGLHPNEVAEPAHRTALAELAELLTRPGVVALGEIGLDYHWERAPHSLQRQRFIEQLALARHHDLPVIIHCRAAYDDLLALLAEAGAGTVGLLHCFGGSLAQLERALALGYSISLAGPITFKRADELRAIAAAVPADRLLIETDAPYLTPHPYRGQRNEPAHLALVATAVATARGLSTAVLGEQTARNTARLFRLEGLIA
jgi:TatD DNase family protein